MSFLSLFGLIYNTSVLAEMRCHFDEIAHAIAEAIGREVTFVDVSPEDFSGALRKLGVPTWQVDGLVEDYAHYARGEAVEVHPTVREVTGSEPRDVAAFARDYASAFIS